MNDRKQLATKRRTFIKTVAGAGAVSLAGCIGGGSGGDGSLTMGAGADGSSTWSTGQAFQKMLRENTEDIRLTAQQTAGTKANLRLFSQGEFDVIGTSNYLYDQAKKGEGDYADNPIETYPKQGFIYGVTHTYMLAREGTGIESYEDLKGKNVWPLWAGSSIRLPLEKFLREDGLWDEMNIRNMSPSDVAGGLESGRVDAIAVYGVSYKGISGWETQVDSRASLRLVEMGDERRQLVDETLASGYEEIEPYGWNEQSFSGKVTAIPMNFRIFFGEEVSEDVVYRFTKAVKDNGSQLTEDVTILPEVSKPEVLAQGTLGDYPVHSGAKKAFDEWGVWNDEWKTGSE